MVNQQSVFGTWDYAIDSSNDSISYGATGGTRYEIYGLALKETSDRVYFAVNANLPVDGAVDGNAVDGEVNWGDLILNFNGSNLTAANGDIVAIRFAADNEAGVANTGIFNRVGVKSVVKDNVPLADPSLRGYNERVRSAGGTPTIGDLNANTSYFNQNQPFANVIKTGKRLGGITRLSAAELSDLNFGTPGKYTFGFSVNKALLPSGTFTAQLSPECGNDMIALIGALAKQPAIDIKKTINGIRATTPQEAPAILYGSSITYGFAVRNTGDIAFAGNDVIVNDISLGPITTLIPGTDVGNDAILSPGEEWLYGSTGIAVSTPALQQNTVTVSVNNLPNVTDTDTAYYSPIPPQSPQPTPPQPTVPQPTPPQPVPSQPVSQPAETPTTPPQQEICTDQTVGSNSSNVPPNQPQTPQGSPPDTTPVDSAPPADCLVNNAAPVENPTPANNPAPIDSGAPTNNPVPPVAAPPADCLVNNAAPIENPAPVENPTPANNPAPVDSGTPTNNPVPPVAAPSDNATPAADCTPAENPTPANNPAPVDNTISANNPAPSPAEAPTIDCAPVDTTSSVNNSASASNGNNQSVEVTEAIASNSNHSGNSETNPSVDCFSESNTDDLLQGGVKSDISQNGSWNSQSSHNIGQDILNAGLHQNQVEGEIENNCFISAQQGLNLIQNLLKGCDIVGLTKNINLEDLGVLQQATSTAIKFVDEATSSRGIATNLIIVNPCINF